MAGSGSRWMQPLRAVGEPPEIRGLSDQVATVGGPRMMINEVDYDQV